MDRTSLRTLAACSAWLFAAAGAAAQASDRLLERAWTQGAAEPAETFATDPPTWVRSELSISGDPASVAQQGEFSELGYRWWVSRGRADVGIGVGAVIRSADVAGASRVLPVHSFGRDLNTTRFGSTQIMTLGMRYRSSEHAVLFADAARVHGVRPDGRDVIGKVGIEFKSSKSAFNIAYGGLGMRLAADTRMTLRIRKGGLVIGMRHTF